MRDPRIERAGFRGHQAEREDDHVRLLVADGPECQLVHGVRDEPQRLSAVVLERRHGSGAAVGAQAGQPFSGQDVLGDSLLLESQ